MFLKKLAFTGAMAAAWLVSPGMIPPVAAKDATQVIYQSAASSPTIGIIPIGVADALGFFEEEGVELEVRYGQGGPMAAQILATGNADMSQITYEPFIKGYEQGLRGKYVLASWDILIYYIGVPADSPIKTVEDLKGKLIGVPSMASASVTIARSILRSAGITPDDSIFQPVGISASAVTALTRGQIDAYASFHSAFASFPRAGVEMRYFRHPVAANIGNGGYFVSQKAIEEKHEAIQGVLRALVKAQYFISLAPEKAIRLYWEQYPTTRIGGSDEEAMAKAMSELSFDQASIVPLPVPGQTYGHVDPKGVETYLGVLKGEGYIDETIPASEVVDDQFIKAANEIDFDAIRALAERD